MRRLRRINSLLGVMPLALFVVFHLWETGAALGGREAFVRRIGAVGSGATALVLEAVFVVLPLAVHVVLSIRIAVRAAPRGGRASYPTVGSRRLQWLTGGLTLVFVLVHLARTWVSELRGTDPLTLYAVLRQELGTVPYFVLFVVGLTAFSFHLGQGLAAFGRTWALVRSERADRVLGAFSAAVGVAVWLVSLNTFSHFAVGQSMLW